MSAEDATSPAFAFPERAPARPTWLVTLADLALLLVGFFVLVQAHAGDRAALASGIRQGFSGNGAPVPPLPAPPAARPIAVAAGGIDGFAPGSAALPHAPDAAIGWARDAAADARTALTVTGFADGSASDVDRATGSGAVLAADRARALAAALAAPAAAAGFQDTAALDRAVASFTGRPIGAEGGARTAVDARLRLAQCPTVALAWHGDAHDAVVVTCSGPAWRVFVPVTRALPAPAVPAAPAALAAARAAPVIRRGDPVLVEAGDAGFSVTREGLALGDAAPGARFLVRVDDAKSPVQAVAVESGRATLPGW